MARRLSRIIIWLGLFVLAYLLCLSYTPIDSYHGLTSEGFDILRPQLSGTRLASDGTFDLALTQNSHQTIYIKNIHVTDEITQLFRCTRSDKKDLAEGAILMLTLNNCGGGKEGDHYGLAVEIGYTTGGGEKHIEKGILNGYYE